ncbi:unnamed protein product [Mytilus coruscus]|uniref:C1q domain-containing protein n=1 Tax=Mytilus coruscus TaxID=42192 RepID=A0A6J8BA75_MYTCO|nr:unnamed protein product [Mytilus coruscus]
MLKHYPMVHSPTDVVRDVIIDSSFNSNKLKKYTTIISTHGKKGKISNDFRKQLVSKEIKETSSIIKRLLLEITTAPTTTAPPLNMKVAFAAALSKTIDSLGSHQAVEYDEVITNEGNAYDARHGHFTAPLKGIYLLSAIIRVRDGKFAALELVKNGQRIDAMVADSRPDAHYSSQSRTFPYVLEQGDMVWLRSYSGHIGHELEGNASSLSNCFADVLLFPM